MGRDRSRIDVGQEDGALDGRLRARFDRHALPDAADAGIPALFAMRYLGEWQCLAVGQQSVLINGRVRDAYQNRVYNIGAVAVQERLDGEGKRRVAAFVRPDEDAVDPDFGEIVHRSEAQQRALSRETLGD